MYLKHLSLVNYKNIVQAEMDFSPKINCFIGANGAGKTNVLDAIYYLSYCKSYTNNIDIQNITHDSDFFVIQGNYVINEVEETVYCGLKRRQKKHFKRNKKEYERLSEHIGVLPLVLVSPDDSRLISDGSDERRRFVDAIISQHDREYLHTLIQYNNALVQRNSLLKNDCSDSTLYEIWEEQLANFGSFIYNKRQQFIDRFVPVFQHYYNYLSQGGEEVSLHYESQLQRGDLFGQLAASRNRDRLLGYTTHGTHKDDLEMLLGTYPIKRVGSQGQNKTYLVALKLAQFSFLKQTSKMNPILLLDDIFDKLDSIRVKQIIHLVSEDNFGQIFITDTNREHLDEIIREISQDTRMFTVNRGGVEKISSQ
ncbi:MAG: DNA replication/repair protein RecF [Prevotellaceae bacterium]|jgi:DNA replication and repair protein RecF|nr:DNA replication/repair protein RecF [Prevotellaceae bacterium]